MSGPLGETELPSKEIYSSRSPWRGSLNAWTQPIRARIDMLSTGMQSPLGLKFSGPDLAILADLSRPLPRALRPSPGPPRFMRNAAWQAATSP